MKQNKRVGYVAIMGRPNVGKSTLMNRILGKKLSITSRKPQTTQQNMLGIKTLDQTQFIFVDTPGLHRTAKRPVNRYMNRQATSALSDVDVILFLVDACVWNLDDDLALRTLQQASDRIPVILVVNKIDKLSDKAALLPRLKALNAKHSFHECVPISAKTADGVALLESLLPPFFPVGEFLFDPDQITDQSPEHLCAEAIREKIIRCCGQEIPYTTEVSIELLQDEGKICRISAVVFAETEGKKAILIGKGGARLKQIGTEARKSIEAILGKQVFLKLWVKQTDKKSHDHLQ